MYNITKTTKLILISSILLYLVEIIIIYIYIYINWRSIHKYIINNSIIILDIMLICFL